MFVHIPRRDGHAGIVELALIGKSVVKKHESTFRTEHGILHHVFLQAQHIHVMTVARTFVEGSNERTSHLRKLPAVLEAEAQVEHIERAVILH